MKRYQASEKKPIELLEEATHLLKTAPPGILLGYLAGTLPFLLGFLYFWTDMSHNAFAVNRCVEGALGMALLFVWMKLWHTVFARSLRAWLAGQPAPRWGFKKILRTLPALTLIHASGWITLPISIAFLVPFGWVYAFYQNVVAITDGEEEGLTSVVRKAARQAVLWPRQNHWALLTLKACSVFVFLNVISAIVLLPALLRMLLGIETSFTQSAFAILNTTFLATAFVLTFLCLDPLVKAFYVLRCYYGESIETGEDIRAELVRLRGSVLAKAAVIVFCLIAIVPGARAQDSASGPPSRMRDRTAVDSAELDAAIREVLRSREFSWRLPRAQGELEEQGLVRETFRRWMRNLFQWTERALDWLWDKLSGRGRTESRSGGGWFNWVFTARGLIVILCIVLAALLAVWLIRWWQRGRLAQIQTESEPLESIPDLEDETVTADHLQEDEWLTLARELFNQGETRLALRALFLSTLAHLSRQQLITIARFKSNLDYERELRRRGHALPETLKAFSSNVAIIDRIWYGMYAATEDLVEEFQTNQQRIQQA